MYCSAWVIATAEGVPRFMYNGCVGFKLRPLPEWNG